MMSTTKAARRAREYRRKNPGYSHYSGLLAEEQRRMRERMAHPPGPRTRSEPEPCDGPKFIRPLPRDPGREAILETAWPFFANTTEAMYR
jgi:hypothetical protein